MQLDLQLGFWADPVYGETNGDYNPFVKKLMTKHADIHGYTVKTLTEEEKALNKGSADFFGLNHYSTRLMTKDPDDFEEVKVSLKQNRKQLLDLFKFFIIGLNLMIKFNDDFKK